jgi:anti-sigma regulatory factor (Ser/Thr protein kinase)
MENILIDFGTQQVFHVGELSEIAVARRAGTALGSAQGFDEVRIGQLTIVITEAATNIVKHAHEGFILLRPIYCDDISGVEILAIDAGPGIADLTLRMQDGNSTAGSYGVGLGAIGRLSQEFDIYTRPDLGTALRVAIWKDGNAIRHPPWSVGSICLPMLGEQACGDALAVESDGDILTWIVADGLGHGPDAALASREAVSIIGNGGRRSTPGILLQKAHEALHRTRGAAVAIGQIDKQQQQLRFSGIGNIAVSVFHQSTRRHLLSHNGIVGSNVRKLQEFCQPWEKGDILIAHSDGVGTRWDLERYPGLHLCHPGIIAAVLYRDFSRGRDDVSVLVLRDQETFP